MKNVEKPIYIKLYEKLLENIENKNYNLSEKLPSENKLAEQFKVNRHTVRQALSLLKDEGFIYSLKEKATLFQI